MSASHQTQGKPYDIYYSRLGPVVITSIVFLYMLIALAKGPTPPTSSMQSSEMQPEQTSVVTTKFEKTVPIPPSIRRKEPPINQPKTNNKSLSQSATNLTALVPPSELSSWRWLDKPKHLPKMTMFDANDQRIRFSDFAGRMVLVNFWATWCSPCRHEMPAFQELNRKLKNKVVVLPVNVEKNALQRAKEFYEEVGLIDLPLILGERSAMGTLGMRGLPTTILLNESGREVARLSGPAEWGTDAVANFLRSVARVN